MPLRICVVGFRNTGKTRLISLIISLLNEQALKTVAIKHSDERFESAIKDTARLMSSNPLAVAFLSPYDRVLMISQTLELEPLIDILNPDVVLYEGFKKSSYPKILTAKEEKDLKIKVQPSLVKMIVAPEALREKALKIYPEALFSTWQELPNRIPRLLRKIYASALPGLDCGLCGYGSCKHYAEMLLRDEAEINQCIVENPPVKLYVNWSKIDLKPYPASVLRALLKAFTDTLKNVKQGYSLILTAARIRKDER